MQPRLPADDNAAIKPALRGGRILDETFSPDGRRILYRSNDGGHWKIYASNLDGSGVRMLSDGTSDHSLFALSSLPK